MKLLFPSLCEASTAWTRIARSVTRTPDLQITATFGKCHPGAELRGVISQNWPSVLREQGSKTLTFVLNVGR